MRTWLRWPRGCVAAQAALISLVSHRGIALLPSRPLGGSCVAAQTALILLTPVPKVYAHWCRWSRGCAAAQAVLILLNPAPKVYAHLASLVPWLRSRTGCPAFAQCPIGALRLRLRRQADITEEGRAHTMAHPTVKAHDV